MEQAISKSNGTWKDIVGIAQKSTLIEQLCKEGWRMCVGDVKRIKYWDNVWIGDTPLRESEDGKYSVKSFVLAAMGRELGVPRVKHVYDNIWRGLVPRESRCYFS
ncbi:hypothetical protein PIB30_018309 [Stylosanthes scabra]|uniref:Uncharacterized protein n=1 Tax=Stylosanthes scabra TaxID=79078 RepID=A0ABU6Z7C6_9FABA|nr:hypothetical protein [Stylosanthes scabra]